MGPCPDVLAQAYTKGLWERVGAHGIYSAKKPKAHFPQAFPLHLKVKSCISEINLSHVFHFFPLTANCSAKAYCHVKDVQNVVFIPNEKTTLSLKHNIRSQEYIHRVLTHISKNTIIYFQLINLCPFWRCLSSGQCHRQLKAHSQILGYVLYLA